MTQRKSTKECPECGGETVIETQANGTKIRRCNDFIEIHNDKPLEACLWEEEIFANGKSKPEFTY